MRKILPLLLCAVLLASCGRNPHFITNKEYRQQVENDFECRMSQFSTLNSQLRLDTLNRAEREAMQFLYAYMPLSDMADYEPAFFLEQVRGAFQAREEMAWGRSVPEDVFRHFVLVYRVNNENLDSARAVFYRELKDRVQGMTMEEAALEVNHWCHEHVAYRASDARTSAPLATLRTSLGRCGEESTFTVTAMRAVGIPARQCYTPRWAHCDDNHAWVEVYVDGQWKFLGACEPDPRLDMGWFSVPSTRCMMVHSKAFGRYHGDEEVVRRTGLYSELNLLSHYAPTRHVTVTVLDPEGKPVEDAKVRFKIYNYAEYYPLSTQTTDSRGCAGLTTGLGDLLIWATDGERYAFEKLDVRQDSTLTLTLPSTPNSQFSTLNFEMVPPVAGEPKEVSTDEETAANAKRLAYEDSLRTAYTATFHSDSPNPFVRKSEGNWAEIEKFIAAHPDCDTYLSTYSDKDLRDITAVTLEAHWTTPEMYQDINLSTYQRGLLPARISNEMVRPYRQELANFKGMTAEGIRQWTIDSITVDDTSNYFGVPLSPRGVYKLRHADRHSRDIFFVAACRAAGVPAYLDNATNTLYAWNGKVWQITNFSSMTSSSSTTNNAKLTLTYRGKEPAKPVYWPHFTLAKLENGDLRTFDFEDDPRMATFPATIELEPGIYCLSTGNRYPDGTVRSRLDFFELAEGQSLTREIVIPALTARDDQLPALDPNMELFDGATLADYAGTEGMLYINLGNYGEPSKHLVVELQALQPEMRNWGGMTLMVGPATIGMADWHLANTDIAHRSGALEQKLLQALKLDLKGNYPLVVLIDRNGQILYHSEGYKIGTAEQVLKTARKIPTT
ncbi:MAG: transglutaminase domain-containing protein [Bacteroidales bacterium]|nr:transglutaminase domain-containing protein [Bacteroidales bacterium]